jgi:AcrR family transcriptional regulator
VASTQPESEAGTVVRRAPFSDNPNVGVRGQRTQQRILDAALRVFGEVGYHQSSIDTIAKVAGCSRVSFYQYFSSKEDVFRHLAVQVARQLNASTDRLDPVTGGADGWAALREWVGRFAEIYDRYRPVFRAFPAAAESDASLEVDSVRTASRYITGMASRVAGATLATRDLDPVLSLVREALSRTLDDGATLCEAAPASFSDVALLDAYTDVVHRALFGRRDEVNVHSHRRAQAPPKLPFGRVMQAALDEDDQRTGDGARGGPARAALLEAARTVFVTRGFHATRVDDIVEAAGVSHGAFYRYFKNKTEIAHLLASQAMRAVSVTLTRIPDLTDASAAGTAALRRWLRDYNRAQVDETAMIRVWVDAALQDEGVHDESAPVLDWGRRRLAHALRPRGFGDPDTDAIVLLSVLDTFGARERPARALDAAVLVVERGFLGRV